MTFSVENIIFYFLVMNVVGYALMWYDKRKAQNGEWRVPERTLFIVALLGGAVGSIIGMYSFRHKTKHYSFTIGMPAILILQIAIFIIYKFQLQDNIINALKTWI